MVTNTSGASRRLMVSAAVAHQPLGVSQTLKVSGMKEIAGDGSSCPVSMKNCPGKPLADRWATKINRGQLILSGELEKLPGEASTSLVSTKDCPGTAQIVRWSPESVRGRVRCVGGPRQMRDSVKYTLKVEEHIHYEKWLVEEVVAPPHRCKRGTPLLVEEGKHSCCESYSVVQNIEPDYEHFSSFKEEYIRRLTDGRWFSDNTIFGEEVVAPPHRCKRGTPLLNKEGKRSCYESYSVFQNIEPDYVHFSSLEEEGTNEVGEVVYNTGNLQLVTDKPLLTIKYYNSPSWGGASKQKNAHLSALKRKGAREPIKNSYQHSQYNSNVLPLVRGGVCRLAEGGVAGTVTNNFKQVHAYET
uniref:hypothetical protein n=1 Tax=uncultured Draconibacterium sp. TaxID=1573823 RepID=UPI0032179823